MKVIDLLNKIANEEEVPNSIRYKKIYYDFSDGDYFNQERVEWLFNDYDITTILNEEVEIIEEEPRDIEVCGSYFTQSEYNKLWGKKKIEKLKWNEKSSYNQEGDTKKVQRILLSRSEQLKSSINEIIDYINKEKE